MEGREFFLRIWRAYGGAGRAAFFFFYRWLVFPHMKVQAYLPEKGNIYDLGCGYGIFSALLALTGPGRKVTGVDSSEFRIARAERLRRNLGLTNLEFSSADFLKTNFADPGAIILADVLHHAGDWSVQSDLLRRLMPSLGKGGKLVVIDVQPAFTWKYYLGLLVDGIFYFGTRVHYPPQDKLKALLEEGGFSVEIVPLHPHMPYMNYMAIGTRR